MPIPSLILASTSTIVNPQLTQSIHDLVSSLAQLAVLAVSTGIGWLIKLAISRLKYDWEKKLATRVVAYAEMKIEGGPEKRAFVAQKLHEKFPRLSAEEIDHMLEEAVLTIKSVESPTKVEVAAAPTPPVA